MKRWAFSTIPGRTLHLYAGLRHKGARLLMRVECLKVEEIIIDRFGLTTGKGRPVVRINDIELDKSEMEGLALRDGFASMAEMLRFWTEPKNRLPFRGDIVHWTFPRGKP